MPKAKFASHRRKKRNFYGSRFTNSSNYNSEGFVDEGNSSVCSQTWNAQVDDEAIETTRDLRCESYVTESLIRLLWSPRAFTIYSNYMRTHRFNKTCL